MTPHRLPPSLRRFLQLWEEGAYWECHEALEGIWLETRSSFYHGLILWASAWVHWERGNAHGVRAQLRKARERLEGCPSPYLGIDVARIRARCEGVRGVVAARPDDWMGRIAPERLEVDPGRIRGDEPELRAESGEEGPAAGG